MNFHDLFNQWLAQAEIAVWDDYLLELDRKLAAKKAELVRVQQEMENGSELRFQLEGDEPMIILPNGLQIKPMGGSEFWKREADGNWVKAVPRRDFGDHARALQKTSTLFMEVAGLCQARRQMPDRLAKFKADYEAHLKALQAGAEAARGTEAVEAAQEFFKDQGTILPMAAGREFLSAVQKVLQNGLNRARSAGEVEEYRELLITFFRENRPGPGGEDGMAVDQLTPYLKERKKLNDAFIKWEAELTQAEAYQKLFQALKAATTNEGIELAKGALDTLIAEKGHLLPAEAAKLVASFYEQKMRPFRVPVPEVSDIAVKSPEELLAEAEKYAKEPNPEGIANLLRQHEEALMDQPKVRAKLEEWRQLVEKRAADEASAITAAERGEVGTIIEICHGDLEVVENYVPLLREAIEYSAAQVSEAETKGEQSGLEAFQQKHQDIGAHLLELRKSIKIVKTRGLITGLMEENKAILKQLAQMPQPEERQLPGIAPAAEQKAEQNYQTAMTADRPAQAEVSGAMKPVEAEARAMMAAAEDELARIAAERERHYQEVMTLGREALTKGSFAEAVRQADKALELKLNDGEAQRLKTEAVATRELEAQREKQYEAAIKSGREALRARHFGEAIRQMDLALGAKPGNLDAGRLKELAENGQRHGSAMETGGKALAAGDFSKAMGCAELALAEQPGDVNALILKEQAGEALRREVEQEQKCQAEMKARGAALGTGKFDQAVKAEEPLLAGRPGEAEATRLKKDSDDERGKSSAEEQKRLGNNRQWEAMRSQEAATQSGEIKTTPPIPLRGEVRKRKLAMVVLALATVALVSAAGWYWGFEKPAEAWRRLAAETRAKELEVAKTAAHQAAQAPGNLPPNKVLLGQIAVPQADISKSHVTDSMPTPVAIIKVLPDLAAKPASNNNAQTGPAANGLIQQKPQASTPAEPPAAANATAAVAVPKLNDNTAEQDSILDNDKASIHAAEQDSILDLNH
jgi:hypothetical protein